MTHDHRECDEFFENLEEFVNNGDFEKASNLFNEWKKVNLRHFEIEENYLFPETAKSMGAKIPPIMVMEMEHQQIRNCINQMEMAINQNNGKTFLGLADTCMIMIQQHNMKEEQILYPIIDRSLSNLTSEAISKIESLLKKD